MRADERSSETSERASGEANGECRTDERETKTSERDQRNPNTFPTSTNLGNSVQALGQGNDLLQLTNRVNSLSNSLCVFRSGTVQDPLDSVNMTVRPRVVRRADGGSDRGEDDEETDGEDGFFVGDVELGADCGGGQAGTEEDTRGLGEEGGGGDRVDDRGGLFIRGGFCGG